jgi:glycosyltransferase involved in cell wall biosynthesis
VSRRVTFVLPSLHGGGAERAAVVLLNGLAERGYESTLFVFAREGEYFEQLSPAVRLVVGEPGRAGRVTSLRKFLVHERQDVVVSLLSHFSVFAAVRISPAGTKYVISQQTPLTAFLDDHDYPWRQPARRRVFTTVASAVYPRADGIAATSSGVADDLISHYGVRRERVAIVPNPVDIEAVKHAAAMPLDEARNDSALPTIVTAGRLAHAKNLPLLVESLEQLSTRLPFRAWLLGQGELEGELRRMLARSPVADRVTLFGFQQNPWKFMARADVFLLTSRYEGFGNVLIEAMAAGLPVVATASYGTRDIVRNGDTGFLVESHDAGSVADALERVLTNVELRTRMAQAARDGARAFAVPAVVSRFETFLETVMQS